MGVGGLAVSGLFSLIYWIFSLFIMYFVIKLAVKSAIRETRDDYRSDKWEQ